MLHRTPLFNDHQARGARLVPFGGWEMPLHYGSQLEEHHAVRQDAGLFDVSHMRAVDLSGAQAFDSLRCLLANDVAKLREAGSALYSCMLNPQGGVVDDLIVYRRGADAFRLVLNAATTESDIAWIDQHTRDVDLKVQPRADLAMLAVQGPQARAKTIAALPPTLAKDLERLKPFHFHEAEGLFIACTGYTGEDGFEIILPNDQAEDLWKALLDTGIRPCGLGARDTLRLEAGMNLYGQDMDGTTSPLISGLGWTVDWNSPERDFIGRDALEREKSQPLQQRLVGLLLSDPGVLRQGQAVLSDGQVVGQLTSGGFSPTLSRSLGLARIASHVTGECTVEIRGKERAARIVRPPFVRHGKAQIAR